MSDFLERVLSAARGEEAALRPRGAGLFEPAELAGPGDAPRPAAAPFPMEPHVRQRADAPLPRRETRVGPPVTSPSLAVRAPSSVPEATDAPARVRDAALIRAAVASVSARPGARASTTDPAGPGLSARGRTRVRPVPAVAPVSGQEPARGEARTAAPAPPTAPAPEGPGDPMAGGEPPVIRVTIGRVEVRATVPPAAAPRRPLRAEPPPLGLAQYLRERREGRR